jgi:putative endonuclease
VDFPWFVYILLCYDNSFYTGISISPEQRFKDHQNGKGGAYTRSHKVVRILYQENVGSKSEALKREAQIKRWSREKKIAILHLPL